MAMLRTPFSTGDISKGKKKFLLVFSPFNVKFCLCTCVGKECFISCKPRHLSPPLLTYTWESLREEHESCPFPNFLAQASDGIFRRSQKYQTSQESTDYCRIVFSRDKTIMPSQLPGFPLKQQESGPCLYLPQKEVHWSLGTTSLSSIQSRVWEQLARRPQHGWQGPVTPTGGVTDFF